MWCVCAVVCVCVCECEYVRACVCVCCMCVCSDQLHKNISMSSVAFRCDAPEKLRGQNLIGLSPEDLRCPRSLIWILLTFVLGIVLLLVVLISLVAWRFRHKLSCRRTHGRYISVYAKDVHDDDEGTATITVGEDELPLKDSEV